VDGERSTSRLEQQRVDVQVSTAAVVPHQTREDRARRRRLCRGGRPGRPARVPERPGYRPRGADIGGTAAIDERSAPTEQRSIDTDQRSPAVTTTPATSSAATADRERRRRAELRPAGLDAVHAAT
jgi:hypothetical protein